MKTLSESTFKTLAGERAYERGYSYYVDGRVGRLSIKGSRITAEVAGRQQYTVVLRHTAKVFEGHCTCPASDNFDFCKHCVAVSLSYYYQTQTNQELIEAPNQNKVLEYLDTLTRPQLVEEMHKLLLRDETAMDVWQLKAEVSSGGLEPKEVRKRITKAIPYKPNGLWRYRDVEHYFSSCELALSGLTEPLLSLEPNNAYKLITYAAERLEKTLQTIDDSGGYRYATEQQIQQWFDTTLLSEEWLDNDRARVLIEMVKNQGKDYSVLNPDTIVASLNVSTKSLVFDALDKEFESLSPQANHYSDEYYYYNRIAQLLLTQARESGDVDREFQILEKGAITVPECLGLVSLCIKHCRLDEAARWLAHANELSEDASADTYNIESAKIDLLKAEGDTRQAFELQWARFEENENLETLEPALATAQDLNEKERWLTTAISFISAKLTPDRHKPKNQYRAAALVDIHIAFDDVQAAYHLSDNYQMHVNYLMNIVAATDTFSNKTFYLIERVVNHIVESASNSAYDQAINYLKQQENRLTADDKLRLHQTVRKIYDLPKNKRKTNFIRRLKSSFPTVFTI